MCQASENQVSNRECQGSTEGNCYYYYRGSKCPSEDRTVVLVEDCKTEVETSVGIFGSHNNDGGSTNGGGFLTSG